MFGNSLLSKRKSGSSKEFFDLVKAIGEARSKQEEDKIIVNEVSTLRERLSSGSTHPNVLKEYIIRALYCEMLGHDASFAHIHAIKLASDKNIWCKRTGYMLSGLILRPKSELLLLLVNTMQKDLASEDFLEVSAALVLCSQNLHDEAFPAVLPSIINLMSHQQDIGLSALLYMYLNDPSILNSLENTLKKAIHETHPGILNAAFALLEAIVVRCTMDSQAKQFIQSFDGLVPSLVSILRETMDNKFSREWVFQKVPAPWLQIKILQLLGLIVGKNKELSEEVYEILRIALEVADDVSSNISYAVTIECINTIACIYPQPSLCKLSVRALTKFIESPNRNLKVAGIVGLSGLVQVDPAYIAIHQLAVIDCLDDRDETLRTETLKLLSQTTNSTNAVAVVQKLLQSATLYFEAETKQKLIANAIQLTERYAPSPKWYLETMTSIMKDYSSFMPLRTGKDVIQLIADGPTGGAEDDMEFRKEAVVKMIEVLMNSSSLDDVAYRVSHWVIGSYGVSLKNDSEFSHEDMLDILLEGVVAKRIYRYHDTYSFLLTCLITFSAHFICHCKKQGSKMPWLDYLLSTLKGLMLGNLDQNGEWNCETRHKIAEFLAAYEATNDLKALYPFDGYSEDVSADVTPSLIDKCLETLKIDTTTRKSLCGTSQNPSTIVSDLRKSSEQHLHEKSKQASKLNYEPYIERNVLSIHGQDLQFNVVDTGRKKPQGAKTDIDFRVVPSRTTGRWALDGYKERNNPMKASSRTQVLEEESQGTVEEQEHSIKGLGKLSHEKVLGPDQNRIYGKDDDERRRRVASELFAGLKGAS